MFFLTNKTFNIFVAFALLRYMKPKVFIKLFKTMDQCSKLDTKWLVEILMPGH